MKNWLVPYNIQKLFLFLWYYDYSKRIKNSRLYIKIFNKHDFMDIIYVDQCGYKFKPFQKIGVSCIYLPYGIKQLDSEYSKRIRNIKESGEDVKKLKNEIKNNENLHKMIKDNLLLNLKNYTK
jgi:hypothetical protein